MKVAYSKNRKSPEWKAHGTYLQREGAQREGERGRGFSADRDDLDLAQATDRWQRANDPHLFKLIVSPENAAKLDLRHHARELMAHAERDLGTRLEWLGIDHYNTDNPHVHLLIRGRRDDGSTLRIDPEYVKSGFRIRSQEIATRALGYRRERDISKSLAREVEAQRFTSLDRSILAAAGATNQLTFNGRRPPRRGARERRTQQIARLQVLSEMGLARKTGVLTWTVSPELPRVLQQVQLLGDISKSVARHRPFLRQPHARLRVFQPAEGREISGRLVGTGLAEELRGPPYQLIEGHDGLLHYVRQTPALERARGSGGLRLGAEVLVRPRTFERDGRSISYLEIREVPLETLESLRQAHGKPLEIADPRPGRVHRGRLVAYARGAGGEARYAVLDTGRTLTALEVRDERTPPGREVEARSVRVDAENTRRRVLTWRLDDLERLLRQERTR